jgi:hypothetical protein
MFVLSFRRFAVALVARARRYDMPGGDGRSYGVPSAVPSCFVLPRVHERQFPALVAWLRAEGPVRSDGPFDLSDLGGRGPRPHPLAG